MFFTCNAAIQNAWEIGMPNTTQWEESDKFQEPEAATEAGWKFIEARRIYFGKRKDWKTWPWVQLEDTAGYKRLEDCWNATHHGPAGLLSDQRWKRQGGGRVEEGQREEHNCMNRNDKSCGYWNHAIELTQEAKGRYQKHLLMWICEMVREEMFILAVLLLHYTTNFYHSPQPWRNHEVRELMTITGVPTTLTTEITNDALHLHNCRVQAP